jgi:hypothetical protein
MISSISSTRVWTLQPTSTASQNSSGDLGGNTSGFSIGSLAGLFYADTSEEDDDYGYDSELSMSMAALPQATAGNMADADGDGAIDDISSNAFMKALNQKIDTLQASEDTRAMATAMREALSAGRLTVTDVVAGEQSIGREPSASGSASGGSAASEASSSEVTTVDTSEWSTFLRDTLLRDSHGLYVRNDDSSHIDKATGSSAYFGMIGDNNYYLSWTAQTDA